MSVERTDRRIQRTRQLLRDALMALIVEKPYEAISIQDITERANVNRATFYLHYHHKDELLYKSMKEVYDALVACIKPVTREDILNGNIADLLDASDYHHVAEHAAFYRVILSEKGIASFTVKARQYLAEVMRDQVLKPLLAPGDTPRIPLDAMAHFLAGAQIGLISWWLEHDMAYTPEQMASMQFEMSAPGMWRVLNLDEDA